MTETKIERFIASAIPDSCSECPFTNGEEWNTTCLPLKLNGCERPAILGELREISYRRHDCPLEVERFPSERLIRRLCNDDRDTGSAGQSGIES